MIAVMGAEAAVNAVFANKIAEKPEAERPAYVEELAAVPRRHRRVEAGRQPARRRGRSGDELVASFRRLATTGAKSVPSLPRRRPVLPV